MLQNIKNLWSRISYGWKNIKLLLYSVLCCPPVALYAISAVYFAGVMVRLMLTLTPVVCMLSAIAFSSVFEHYLGDDTKKENPPAEDSSDEDDKRNSGNLYDKVTRTCFTQFKSHIRSTFCRLSFAKLTSAEVPWHLGFSTLSTAIWEAPESKNTRTYITCSER